MIRYLKIVTDEGVRRIGITSLAGQPKSTMTFIAFDRSFAVSKALSESR